MLFLGQFCLSAGLILLGHWLYLSLQASTAKKHQWILNQVSKDLHDQFYFITPKQIQKKFRFFVLFAFIFCLYTQSIWPLALGIGLYIYGPFVYLKWVQHKRLKYFRKQLLTFFPFLSSMLNAGHTLEKAIEQISYTSKPPLSQEMQIIQKEMQLGKSFERSMFDLSQRMPDPHLKMVLVAINLSRKMGTNLSSAIDQVSIHIHEKEKLLCELKTLTAQGKMQAWVTGIMPFFVVLGLEMIAPGYIAPLFQTQVGLMTLIYCFFSLAVGMYWIYKITHQKFLEDSI